MAGTQNLGKIVAIDIEECTMDFEKDVVENSHQQPLIVDFWAPWCGPCQVIGPALEALEVEQSRWKLVKINVDDHPAISQQLGIRGIPDVRLYWKGTEVSRFTGALPKHEIEKWLEQNIPDERMETLASLTAAVQEDTKRLEELRAFVSGNSDFKPGLVALAKVILWNNPSESAALLAEIKLSDREYTLAKPIREMAELLQLDLVEDLPVAKVLNEAKKAFAGGDRRLGIDRLIQAVMMNKQYANELPRRAAIAFFQLVGVDDQLTKEFRRKFDMALY